jgi:hypothetical protein
MKTDWFVMTLFVTVVGFACFGAWAIWETTRPRTFEFRDIDGTIYDVIYTPRGRPLIKLVPRGPGDPNEQ